jgi:hypothetical protein
MMSEMQDRNRVLDIGIGMQNPILQDAGGCGLLEDNLDNSNKLYNVFKCTRSLPAGIH